MKDNIQAVLLVIPLLLLIGLWLYMGYDMFTQEAWVFVVLWLAITSFTTGMLLNLLRPVGM